MVHITVHVVGFVGRAESVGPDPFFPHHVSITAFSGSPYGISRKEKDRSEALTLVN